MVAGGQSWADSIHRLSGLRVWALRALLHAILLSPSSLVLQCDCGNESANCETAQKPSPLLPELSAPPHHPILITTPDPFFLPLPGTEPQASYFLLRDANRKSHSGN